MPPATRFPWPGGKQAAVSLTFDDARVSQVDRGIPLLDTGGVKGTFYVSLDALHQRQAAWQEAARRGHEIGNHTVRHPCSGNYCFEADNALEDYSLEQMEPELLAANAQITKLVGVTPVTFAYPCGEKFVGRGTEVRSYVPLVARHFTAGRGFGDEAANHPWKCDLAQLFGVDFDRLSFADVKPRLEAARESGSWLVFAGHEMCVDDRQAVRQDTLEQLCRYLTDPANGFWVDTVAVIAAYLKTHRGH